MKKINFKAQIIGIMVVAAIIVSGNLFAQPGQRILKQQFNNDTRLHRNFRADRMPNQNFAQDRAGRGMGLFGLNLTEEQTLKFNELRTKNLKESLVIKNEMLEYKARLRTLTTSEDFDQKEIDQLIDKMSDSNAKQMKQRVAHRQEIRSLLTEEQRVIFDSSNQGFGQRQSFGRKGRAGNRAMRPGFGFKIGRAHV